MHHAKPEEQEGDEQHDHNANNDGLHGDVLLRAVDGFS